MNSYVGKAVKFQHRVSTGHSIPGKPFTVESKNPLAAPDDPASSQTVKQQFRHHTPVPTELVVDDALILVAPPAQDDGEPRVSLLYLNGKPMMGGDWQNAVSVEHDVPHVDRDGAEDGERFWWDAYGETTEGRAEALQAIADEMAVKPASTSVSTLISSVTGNFSLLPVTQGDPAGYQQANPSDGQQDGKPVAGIASQVPGQQADPAQPTQNVAGDPAQVSPAPSPEQPAQQ